MNVCVALIRQTFPKKRDVELINWEKRENNVRALIEIFFVATEVKTTLLIGKLKTIILWGKVYWYGILQKVIKFSTL